MLLREVLSSDSAVDWFVQNVSSVMDAAIFAMKNEYDQNGSERLAKLRGGSVIGRWVSANLMGRGQNNIASLVKYLNRVDLMIHPPGTKDRREDEKWSFTSALLILIIQIIPELEKRRMTPQATALKNAIAKYKQSAASLGQEELDSTPAKQPRPQQDGSTADKNTQAHAIINTTIQSLPREIQHQAREFVSRRGFTLQALRDFMDQNKLK